MTGAWAVFMREMLLERRRALKSLLAAGVTPFLFLVAFGWGLGDRLRLDGVDYLSFLAPGLMAMSSMTRAFGIAQEINIARFYWGVFEELQTAPIPAASIALGEVMAGCLRGLTAAAVVWSLARLFGAAVGLSAGLVAAVVLNAFIFASLAVAAAMWVRSHSDQALIANFVITPMAFLSGTFFATTHLPGWMTLVLDLLPLTHTTRLTRAAALGLPWNPASLAAGIGFAAVFFGLAVWSVGRARD